MVDKAVAEPRERRPETSPRDLTRTLKAIAHDALELAELQAELASTDVKQMINQSVAPLLVIGAALCIVLGTVPVLLAALALGLLTAGWSGWLAFLVAGGVGLLLAALLGFAGIAWLRPKLRLVERSKVELSRNIQWLKQSLRQMRDEYAA